MCVCVAPSDITMILQSEYACRVSISISISAHCHLSSRPDPRPQSKIRKRSWVLHECVERVPENVDAARELLQYGLKGTDLDALIAIGSGEDGGRSALSSSFSSSSPLSFPFTFSSSRHPYCDIVVWSSQFHPLKSCMSH